MCEGTIFCPISIFIKELFALLSDTFVIDQVVNTNELLSDLTPNAHIGLENPDFNEDPLEVHSVYVAIGTLTAAICIVAVVVSIEYMYKNWFCFRTQFLFSFFFLR